MPEVVDWLKTLGMSEYAEHFAEKRHRHVRPL